MRKKLIICGVITVAGVIAGAVTYFIKKQSDECSADDFFDDDLLGDTEEETGNEEGEEEFCRAGGTC